MFHSNYAIIFLKRKYILETCLIATEFKPVIIILLIHLYILLIILSQYYIQK